MKEEEITALGKQEKDAEGEEMLTVSRKKVQDMYKDYCTERDNEEKGSVNRFSLSARIAMLDDLFGSKCLPDEVGNEDNFASKESKYHKGDKVVLLSDDDGVYEVECKTGKHHYALKGVEQDVHEEMLIPYEEPKPAEPKDGSNYSEKLNSSDHISDPTKMVDNIIKDGFRDHNRLHIAAMAMQGILSNDKLLHTVIASVKEISKEKLIPFRAVASASFLYADALIKEAK